MRTRNWPASYSADIAGRCSFELEQQHRNQTPEPRAGNDAGFFFAPKHATNTRGLRHETDARPARSHALGPVADPPRLAAEPASPLCAAAAAAADASVEPASMNEPLLIFDTTLRD